MPRKWSNNSSGGCGTHLWVEPAPFHIPLDLRVVDEILAMNKRIADIEKRTLHKRTQRK